VVAVFRLQSPAPAGTIGPSPRTADFTSEESSSMKQIVGMLLLAGALVLTGAGAADEDRARKDNTPPEGFTALFNGKDLTGWQGLIELPARNKMSPEERSKEQKKANEKYLPHWTVQDGVLHYDGKGQSLQTVKDYGDFELYVDWKIGPKGDSGIYLRGNPQVQIWDNPVGSGGLYNNQKHPSKPLKVADKPVGQWNTFHIIMKGDRVTVFLNGEKVVDDTPMENYWEKGKKPLPNKGPIELQHHGDELWFKNIYIKELPN
jgi:hypothetical protein